MRINLGKRILTTFLALIMVISLTGSALAEEIVQNRFYSGYNPGLFNDVNNTYNAKFLQYRMNCYGYAIQVYRYGSITSAYKQQPGEFASSADHSSITQNVYYFQPTKTMSHVVANMQLDARRLGYTMTEYAPQEDTVKQALPGTRMIALVTGSLDFHYYMQHSDGTWSHKPGTGKVTNLSIVDSVPLKNENIKAKANQGLYSSGPLKFFLITKDAVTDYPHGAYDAAANQEPLYFADKAGEYPITATNANVGPIPANMDFAKDTDVYCFRPSVSKTYVLSTSCASDADLDAVLYDSSGMRINYDGSVGQVNMSHALVAGNKYYIRITNFSETMIPYTFSIL
ncbi:MAG: hypothetical protein ACM3PP_08330 [Candidatus Saccharibacteria bacterium]